MKNIEIKTTQNVVLEYELAGLRDRIIAYFIDLAALVVGVIILNTLGLTIFSGETSAYDVYLILTICVFIFYSFAMESFNHGQSLGKMAMKIQVIRAAGGQATYSDYAARWAFRLIDIYLTLGGVASILIASSTREQRIGDIVANTAVVKLRPKTEMDLDDLLAIHSVSSYVPKYVQVKHLSEADMLLIKSVLYRYDQFRNDAHEDALHATVERIREVLGINPDGDPKKFLQTLLKDYVVLTR